MSRMRSTGSPRSRGTRTLVNLTRPRPSSVALERAEPPISRDQNETMAFGNCLDSPAVERALAEVEGLSDPLAVASRLRASLPTPLARAAAGLHDLRSRAQGSASRGRSPSPAVPRKSAAAREVDAGVSGPASWQAICRCLCLFRCVLTACLWLQAHRRADAV